MSEKDFKDYKLSEEIARALSVLNYHKPTKVQRRVIPLALKQKDLIVKSQTGSGKTASFGIPICELLLWEENKPQALILTPTRELALQVKEDIINIGRFKRIKAVSLYGKQSFVKQKIELNQKAHVVVGTPGRVLDHIQKGTFPIEKLEYLIIDEADEMLSMGFIDQVQAIIEELPKKRVTSVFSATFPEEIKSLCLNYMQDPITIEIETSEEAKHRIQHSYLKVEEQEKFSLLKDITAVENPDSCIIFCNTQQRVDEVFDNLDNLGYPCDKIHGGMYQEDRFDVMKDFKKGIFRYLVATDVAARGIDIEDITLIVNYDIPFEKESYVHRTGRTGRAGKKGKAISFITQNEEGILTEIEEYIGMDIPLDNAPSEEEVQRKKDAFEEKLRAKVQLKENKTEKLNKSIMKLYFNGGKSKKIRAVDFVGTIAKINGVTADDIGIITIGANSSFVEILNGKGPLVLEKMKRTTIKGKLLKVHQARD
ncbi:DEAD/DEAH box helicase [Bacillus dakarensis]|uniref:DEAD/DEAH box helicase n=1 Tax=Robertmurraya dakarensis TaxID=1926278 RepID=UPI000981145A|nr:DEAD/DEAH box helicase [Bacillus dakarensis]